MSATLSYATAPQLLAEALAEFARGCPPEGAAVLLYSGGECKFGLLRTDGTVCDSANATIRLGPVYEARAFHPGAELRWWNDPSPLARHRAVTLTERGGADDALCAPIPQTYLLWGEGTGNKNLPDPWSELSTARIGKLRVPLVRDPEGKGFVRVEKRQRVLLCAVEYLARHEHGNVAVVEERLTELRVHDG